MLNRCQIYACRRRYLSFVSGCELENLLFCEIGWQLKMDGETQFRGAKEDKKNRKLDEDKKGDSKEEEAGYQSKESEVFWW